VLRGKESVIALKYYSFTENSNHPLRDDLHTILKDDVLLQQRMSEAVVIYNLPDNCLVPSEQYNPDINRHLLYLLHGDLKDGTVLNERLEGEGVYNVFRVPDGIHEYFQGTFPNGKYWHYFSAWMKSLRENERSMTDFVNVIFYPNNLLVAVNKTGKLQLMQSLQYQTPEDVAYHLLNIYHQFHFNQEELPLDIGGMVQLDSSVYEELQKYFQVIEKERLPGGLALHESFQSYPEHFFSPFLKLALCVS
jgi:hypothetical protein